MTTISTPLFALPKMSSTNTNQKSSWEVHEAMNIVSVDAKLVHLRPAWKN
jgi:hypothetical protein